MEALTKNGMKFFQKKEKKENKDFRKPTDDFKSSINSSDNDNNMSDTLMVPATPKTKMRRSGFLKAPVTPTLTDASYRGEQKRAVVLQSQLQEVSLTAAKAYDQIADLKMKNNMLEDQVIQQKQLLDKLMKQLDQANLDKQQLKTLYDQEVNTKVENLQKKSVIEENTQKHNNDADMIEQLKSEKNGLLNKVSLLETEVLDLKTTVKQKNSYIENEKLKSKESIEKGNESYNNNTVNIKTRGDENFKSLPEPTLNNLSIASNDEIQNYKDCISKLEKEVTELKEEKELKDMEYEDSLSILKNTVKIMKENSSFLNRKGYSNFSNDKPQEDDNKPEGGESFTIPNLSFIP